jgi:hypothetical protein
MKYYYGNSMKEALSNPAIEIKSAKQLESYKEVYSIVIRCEELDGLPTNVDMPIDSCLADAIEDEVYVEEAINDYLSDTYGYCMWDYSYEVDKKKPVIHITDIEWDVTDTCDDYDDDE